MELHTGKTVLCLLRVKQRLNAAEIVNYALTYYNKRETTKEQILDGLSFLVSMGLVRKISTKKNKRQQFEDCREDDGAQYELAGKYKFKWTNSNTECYEENEITTSKIKQNGSVNSLTLLEGKDMFYKQCQSNLVDLPMSSRQASISESKRKDIKVNHPMSSRQALISESKLNDIKLDKDEPALLNQSSCDSQSALKTYFNLATKEKLTEEKSQIVENEYVKEKNRKSILEEQNKKSTVGDKIITDIQTDEIENNASFDAYEPTLNSNANKRLAKRAERNRKKVNNKLYEKSKYQYKNRKPPIEKKIALQCSVISDIESEHEDSDSCKHKNNVRVSRKRRYHGSPTIKKDLKNAVDDTKRVGKQYLYLGETVKQKIRNANLQLKDCAFEICDKCNKPKLYVQKECGDEKFEAHKVKFNEECELDRVTNDKVVNEKFTKTKRISKKANKPKLTNKVENKTKMQEKPYIMCCESNILRAHKEICDQYKALADGVILTPSSIPKSIKLCTKNDPELL